MNDQQLLEFAAKAAGWDFRVNDPDSESYVMVNDKGICFGWNPLINDSNALELAGELRLDICHHWDEPFVIVVDSDALEKHIEVSIDGDYCKAARRAIVLAAAKIWEAAQ